MAKNSLVANINRRKKAGISRPKPQTTVSDKAWAGLKTKWGKRPPRRDP